MFTENNATQTVVPNTPVEQDEQRPKEGQTSGIQTGVIIFLSQMSIIVLLWMGGPFKT